MMEVDNRVDFHVIWSHFNIQVGHCNDQMSLGHSEVGEPATWHVNQAVNGKNRSSKLGNLESNVMCCSTLDGGSL